LGHVVREDRTVLSSSWPPAPLPQRSTLLQFYTSSHWKSTISLPCISTLLRPGPLAKSPQRVSLLYTARYIAVASSSAPGRASGANSVKLELSCSRSVRRRKCRNAINVVWSLTGLADREDEREVLSPSAQPRYPRCDFPCYARIFAVLFLLMLQFRKHIGLFQP
jgi:hypothetical protein